MTPTHGFIPTHAFTPTDTPLVQLAPLIGLGGKLRAGKDAVGDYLEEHHGYTKLGMSDALNEALLALNPYIPLVELGGQSVRYRDLHDRVGYVEAKKHPEVRRLLQILGTEVGREMIDPDVWVNIAVRRITELRQAGVPVVITAVRFPNEVEMIRRLGGTTVWIERPTEARTDAQGDILTHASETSVSEELFDTVIHNDSTLDRLYGLVETFLELTTPKGGHELPDRFGSNVTS